MPRLARGGTQAAPSSIPTSPSQDATGTTGEHGASAQHIAELRVLLYKAEGGDKQAFDLFCARLGAAAPVWEEMGNMAHRAQEAVLMGFLGPNSLISHEVQRRKCAALTRELAGAAPTPLERLLVERIVLCGLHLYCAETIYAQNLRQLSIPQQDFHQRRMSQAQARYLAAIRTLAQVRRLQVSVVQVNIAEQQLNVAAITSAHPQL